jgi:hypothetical protein
MRDEERGRVEELWTRFVARQVLAPAERTALAAALESDEVLRRRLIHDLQLDGVLRAAGDLERGQESVIAQIRALVTAAGRTEEVVAAVRRQLEAKAAARRRADRATAPGRAFRWVAGVSLLVGSAAALLLLWPRGDNAPTPPSAQQERSSRWPARGRGALRPSTVVDQRAGVPAGPRAIVARVEALEGAVYRHGPDGTRRAAPALDVGAGDWVSTAGESARARLTGPAGSQIDLAGDAVLALSAEAPEAGDRMAASARLFLAHGRASAVLPAAPSGAGVVFTSPHAIVSGQGTVRMDVAASFTRVEVREGRARVSALGVQRGTDVMAGQLALVSADELEPVRTQNAPREALLLVGPDDTKEEPAAPGGLRGSEDRMKNRLERLGFRVQVADAGALAPERAREVALLVLSSSVSSKQLKPSFAELPVPMLVLESTGFEQLGLTGSRWKRDLGPAPPMTEILIQNPTHPLAGGMSGNVRVLNAPVGLRWAAPPPGASFIATYPGAPAQGSLMFGYERGAPMANGGTAAARRVALFFGNGRVIRALTEQGWKLFDAAALWATGS